MVGILRCALYCKCLRVYSRIRLHKIIKAPAGQRLKMSPLRGSCLWNGFSTKISPLWG